ncbi:hypothetical protein AX17_002217 [Amanita inopinata Kibby_2008]|nr:hypothetical protein AX17_002217 [Amanita inopinata Kibby_2008]
MSKPPEYGLTTQGGPPSQIPPPPPNAYPNPNYGHAPEYDQGQYYQYYQTQPQLQPQVVYVERLPRDAEESAAGCCGL